MFGANYEFYDKDKRSAIQVTVEQKSYKKKQEQNSGEPGEDESEQG